MTWTTPKSWSVNDIISTSDMNTYIRDNENAFSKLTSYTPSWTASTSNPTLGNAVLQGRYIAMDDWCYLWIGLVYGSTSAAGSGQYAFSIPFAAAGTFEHQLDAHFLNAGTSRHRGVALIAPGSSSLLVYEPTTWASLTSPAAWSNSVPYAFTTGDTIVISGIYRRV